MIWERKQKECMLGIFKISITINSMYKKIEMSVVHVENFHNIILCLIRIGIIVIWQSLCIQTWNAYKKKETGNI